MNRLVPLLVLGIACRPAPPPPDRALVPIPAANARALDLTISASPATVALGPATLVVDGYPADRFSPQDFPLFHVQPTFRWIAPGPISAWPTRASPEPPPDVRLVAWLDLNDNHLLDLGDHVSRSISPGAAPAELTISRIYVRRAAMARHVPVEVELQAAPEIAEQDRGRLALYGYTEDQLHGGELPEVRPAFEWQSADKARTWPAVITVPMPVEPELWVFPLLMTGDLFDAEFGAPVAVRPTTGRAVVRIDRPIRLFDPLTADEPTR